MSNSTAGNHEELMARQGMYMQMVRAQDIEKASREFGLPETDTGTTVLYQRFRC